MILLFNAFTLLVCLVWNASILLGTMWLILEKDWSPWTLVATLFFAAKWKIYKLESIEKDEEEDASKIITNT